MEDGQISALMKYVHGEINFAEWIESGAGAADVEQIEDNEVQDGGGDSEGEIADQTTEATNVSEESNAPTEVTTSSGSEMVILVSDPIFTTLSVMGSQEDTSRATGIPNQDTGTPPQDTGTPHQNTGFPHQDTGNASCVSSHSLPAMTTQRPTRMTDLLLQDSAAKSAQKHGGTGVDEFMEEIPMQRRRKVARRKLSELPSKFKHTMGHVNILWARGEIEEAKEICMELIRQVPKCSEPFQSLGMMFEEQGDREKALQFFLIAAYLSKSGDPEDWVKLAMMSLEQNDFDQALTCYNQALKVEPMNANILWDRAALCYQMNNLKKALEYYEMARQAMNSHGDDGAKYIDLVCEMAKLYHENRSVTEAINVLEAAFSKYPDHVNNQAMNMLADLHMSSKAYQDALQMILKHSDVRKEARPEPSDESPLTSFSLLMSPTHPPSTARSSLKDNDEAPVNLILPEDFPIDLRVKIVVCVIHLRQLDLVKEILYPLFLQPVESVGDLYIDVAEAYAENGDYEEALPILDILTRSKKYSMAGVWLKKGECLHSLGRVEEAALAYAQVVNLAPNHLDARLILASLHQQLGRPNQALDVLSDPRCTELPQDTAEQEFAMDTACSSINTEELDTEPVVHPEDFRLLFHKCALLHSQNRVNEFLEAGIELFRLFFSDVFDHKELTDIALRSVKFKRAEVKKNEALEQEEPRSKTYAHSCSKGDTGIRNEEWWEMFKKVVSTLSHHKRHAETQHLVLCALSSDRFFNSDFQTDLIFMSIVALYLNREYRLAFDAIKILITRDRHKPLLWNLMARITAKSGDSRHQRYILRLLIKHPDELPLVLYSGHNAAVSASYRFAIGEYVRAFRQVPLDPLVTLCLGLQYIHLACQRFPRSRHACVLQGVIFMFQYLGLRGECQEAFYNIGRAFHQLGLLQFAVHYYNKALAFPLYEASKNDGQTTAKFSGRHDLHRETAFNLSLIYRKSGNELLAKELLMTHCWV